ncbi:hypothetical protein BHL83_01615 [Limosilactobacillus reuteri]|jgi:hypothetical protein|uniref:Lipoprotein n=3 Tax=Limosilactobacillus reuteri TaxID=1598 RepID=A0A1V4FNY0_LIMRT|nr:hypothetical protein [Limosilactobacillus reuteri]CCC03197.1 hypothetical protein LRATCC53608_0447 [Limosilactobacillus reuteri subsp. suis]AGN99942.1 hypothetical protein LRI_1733 [Limosilactobacillus reuteri I5007]AMY13906.1 hypothetical protein ADV92_04905 [Limosilactobacillus reuteri]MCC4340620.1 hypothetical protein [Limosilactobacillus reuteri]MCC4346811.1 hypothetical protein [Limosilactobacillus reuteri]
MTTIKFFKKAMVGTAAVATIFALAGCGKQSASSSDTSSSSTSSVRSSESKASKAYRTANKLIQNHDYEGAYEQLSQLNDHNAQTEALADDLQSYMNAQKAYENGDYDGAKNNLKSQKSTSPAMRNAYADLQSKVSSAQGSTSSQTSSSTNSKQTNKQSSSTSSATQQSSSAANQAASDATSDNVVQQFANKMGFSGSQGYQIMPTGKTGNVYKFEVRQNNSDNTVASLIGIYQYNSQTGAVTKIA